MSLLVLSVSGISRLPNGGAGSTGGGGDWVIPILFVGLVLYGLLQNRGSRRTVWKSRWASVAPLLWAVSSDVRFVVTYPIRATAMRRRMRGFSNGLTDEAIWKAMGDRDAR